MTELEKALIKALKALRKEARKARPNSDEIFFLADEAIKAAESRS